MGGQWNRTRKCRTPQPCIYYSKVDGTCGYGLITGHSRILICGPGNECTVKETDHRDKRLSMSVEEEDAAKKLYDQGFSDPVIAQALNQTRVIIRGWRLRSGLPANKRGGRPKGAKNKPKQETGGEEGTTS